MPDRKRIVTLAFHVARFAIGKACRHVLSHTRRKGAILRSVPETDRNIDIFKSKSPRGGKDLRVDGEPFY